MKNKGKLFSIALASLVIIVFLVGITGAVPYKYITKTGSDNFLINTPTNEVTTVKNVKVAEFGVIPNGTKVYVANSCDRIFALPVAGFKSNVSEGYVPLFVQFTDTSTPDVIEWNWDFGDGSPLTKERNPKHTYSAVGNYTVTLTVTEPRGERDSKNATITVLAQPVLPTANFSSNVTSGYSPLTVKFIDLSTNETSVCWDFGDGNNSKEHNPTHTYSLAGNYTVNLTAKNTNGTDSKLAIITVKAQKLTAAFSASPTSGTVPLRVKFIDRSADSPTSWNWKFGNCESSNKKDPVNTYRRFGKYTVSLKVKNDLGQSDSITKPNYINVKYPPTASVANYSETQSLSKPLKSNSITEV